jgi:hypothetical protein
MVDLAADSGTSAAGKAAGAIACDDVAGEIGGWAVSTAAVVEQPAVLVGD